MPTSAKTALETRLLKGAHCKPPRLYPSSVLFPSVLQFLSNRYFLQKIFKKAPLLPPVEKTLLLVFSFFLLFYFPCSVVPSLNNLFLVFRHCATPHCYWSNAYNLVLFCALTLQITDKLFPVQLFSRICIISILNDRATFLQCLPQLLSILFTPLSVKFFCRPTLKNFLTVT